MASSQNKPDKMNQQLKQTEDEFIKAERYRRAIAAKQLLDNTLVSELLDTMIKEHYEAFINLPVGSNIDEYKTVHHSALAVKRLKDNLTYWVKQYELMQVQDDAAKQHRQCEQQDNEEKVGIPNI